MALETRRERTKAGLASARARGRAGGRPKLAADEATVLMAKRLQKDNTLSIADICKRKPDWVRRCVRRYNAEGPEGLIDQRGGPMGLVLEEEGQQALRHAVLEEEPPGGWLWTGKKVARWIEAYNGVTVTDQTGRNYLHRLDFSRQRPRPRHPETDPAAQEAFKKGGSKAFFEW